MAGRGAIRSRGQLFYASVEQFSRAFDFKEALDEVSIDVGKAHIWVPSPTSAAARPISPR